MIEELVYAYLCTHHRGKDNLIKNKELRKLFDVNDDKSMRKVIQNIRQRDEFEESIGSISGKNGGFYICITDSEEKQTEENLTRRADEIYKTVDIMKRKWEKKKGLGE